MKLFRAHRGVLPARLLLLLLPVCGAAVAQVRPPAQPPVEFRLANGMQVLVAHRPNVPVVSLHLRVRAGMADERAGGAGAALMVQRMFGEGSEQWGSRKPADEKAAFDEAEQFLAALREEENRGDKGSEVVKGQHEAKARFALGKAEALSVERGYFTKVLERQAASKSGNAVSADFSDYWATLDAHRAEVWFKMMAEFLAHPSTRFFYSNRNEMLSEQEVASKGGAFQRDSVLFAAAFLEHPYRKLVPTREILTQVLATDALAFHKEFYVPSNVVVGITGDLSPAEAKRLAELHFGRLPAIAPPAAKKVAMPPAPREDQRFRVMAADPPLIVHYWYRPDSADPDDPVFDILQAVLAAGRSARMPKQLAEEQTLAVVTRCNSRYPGARFPALFTMEVMPSPNRVIEDVDSAMLAFADQLGKQAVTAEELAEAKKYWNDALVNEAVTGPGRAAQLVRLQTEYGSFRLEDRLAKLNAVTLADCQRVVNKYIAAQPRFVVQQLLAVDRPAGEVQQ